MCAWVDEERVIVKIGKHADAVFVHQWIVVSEQRTSS